MQEHVELGFLLSRYGALLTPRQRELLSMAVDEDFSLSEISEQAGISRQGARDVIQRAAAQLHAYEDALGDEKRARQLRELAGKLAQCPAVMADQAARTLVENMMEIIDNGV